MYVTKCPSTKCRASKYIFVVCKLALVYAERKMHDCVVSFFAGMHNTVCGL